MERQINQSDKDTQALHFRLHSQQQLITEQHQKIHTQHVEIQSQSERIEELEQQLDWLKRQVFGRKSERLVLPGQSELFADAAWEAVPPEDETEQISYERRKPKRMPLPKDLPRERIELDG